MVGSQASWLAKQRDGEQSELDSGAEHGLAVAPALPEVFAWLDVHAR